MNPADQAILYNRRNDGGAGRIEHVSLDRVAQDLPVRRGHCRGQEQSHICKHRSCLFLKHRRHHLQGQLRCHFTLRMPAHAIGQKENSCATRVAVAHPIFVDFPTALAADLEDGKLHLSLPLTTAAFWPFFLLSVTMVSNCRRTFSTAVSLV